MAVIQFPSNPPEGTFHYVTPDRKYRFTNGAWKLHVNNPPVGVIATAPTFPPVTSEESPSISGNDVFWFDPSDDTSVIVLLRQTGDCIELTRNVV